MIVQESPPPVRLRWGQAPCNRAVRVDSHGRECGGEILTSTIGTMCRVYKAGAVLIIGRLYSSGSVWRAIARETSATLSVAPGPAARLPESPIHGPHPARGRAAGF